MLLSCNRARLFSCLSVSVAALVFGLNSWSAWDSVAKMKEQYPYESLEGRVRFLSGDKVSAKALNTLPAKALNTLQWEDLEERVEFTPSRRGLLSREQQLQT